VEDFEIPRTFKKVDIHLGCNIKRLVGLNIHLILLNLPGGRGIYGWVIKIPSVDKRGYGSNIDLSKTVYLSPSLCKKYAEQSPLFSAMIKRFFSIRKLPEIRVLGYHVYNDIVVPVEPGPPLYTLGFNGHPAEN